MPSTGTSPRFDTGQIGPLRDILCRFGNLKATIGDFVRIRVVVDANFVIQELMQRVRYPERRTALEEVVRATVIEAYAPRWLDKEMESAITQTAAKRRLSAEKLRSEWHEYRQLLKWDNALQGPLEHGKSAPIDPKDTPYIVLENKIAACGILTKDPHIKQMGGHPLTLDFVFSARRYARGAVACVSVRVMGVVVSMMAIKALVESVRGVTRALAALPDGVKALLILAAVAALLHPGARKWVCDLSAEIGVVLLPIWNAMWDVFTAMATFANESQAEATVALGEVSAAARILRPIERRPRRARRMRRGTKEVSVVPLPGRT
jgi:predicted nucleic acid-binding protein